MKANGKYFLFFYAVQCGYKLTFESVNVKASAFLWYCSPQKVVLTFESVDEILSVAIQMEAIEQYLVLVLFIMLYKVVLTFESVDEILKCSHSHES